MKVDLKNEAILSAWAKYRIVFYIIIFLVVVGIGIAVYFSIRNKSKQAGINQGVRDVIATIPNNDGVLDQAQMIQIGQLATEVETDFSGWGWSADFKNQTVTDLHQADDDILTGVYYQYKIDRPSQDLITDLESLKYVPWRGTERDEVVARLKHLIFNQ